ncbi:riboflavin synthase [Acuticoccus sediminis]|uniref:Riboflavin synthase n=1 Tax=Acuticoccus sediminis TaxID=2184697 RepID=A0A8B2NLQ1_9HYPH|nr:riboflavin synthase [Acuticoccus sediminis]RAH98744.1 riboflavin synthase [Acuticoccus sediminis]
MFTGIITDVGTITRCEAFGDGARLTIASAYPVESIAIGASIACSGCCLTVTTLEPHGTGSAFSVDVSGETMDKTTIGSWKTGDRINLERSLKAGDELGGHLVSGHVDGRAEIVERVDGEEMTTFRFAPPPQLMPLLAHKGSVALDGTSLTVNDPTDTIATAPIPHSGLNEPGETFTVAMIPHTLAVTTWADRRPGDLVNIEVDTIARYVARLVGARIAG